MFYDVDLLFIYERNPPFDVHHIYANDNPIQYHAHRIGVQTTSFSSLVIYYDLCLEMSLYARIIVFMHFEGMELWQITQKTFIDSFHNECDPSRVCNKQHPQQLKYRSVYIVYIAQILSQ